MQTKYLTLLLFILLQSRMCGAQDEALTKQEMYADFDYLVNVIEETDPYLDIKNKLFEYAILDTIHTFRSQIEECSNFYEFHLLINKVLNTCINGHSAVLTPGQWPIVNLYIPLAYQNGDYIIKRSFRYNNIDFKAGAKLTAINGNKNIHQEIRAQVPYRFLMRWDNRLKLFYSEIFYLSNEYIAQGSIELEFEMDRQSINSKFNFADYAEIHGTLSNDTKHVAYFEESKILYVRVPTMHWTDRNFYKKEIAKTAKGNEVDKVVIDVRNNLGGSSLIGRSIFRSILPKPITMQTRMYGSSSKNISRRYAKTHRFNETIRTESLNELDGLQMNCYINATETIKPYKQSISHAGAIYIIGNEQVYSAGGAIFMFANYSNTDSIFSIGTPTGYFLGEFSDPVHFTLPNSRLEVQISPTMSMTNVESLENVMLDTYDHVIYPSISDYENFYQSRDALYSEEYLMKFDPYFKPIIQKQ